MGDFEAVAAGRFKDLRCVEMESSLSSRDDIHLGALGIEEERPLTP
jgi:hypothetical protein